MRQTALTIVLSLLCAVIHAADVVWFDGSHPITYSIPTNVEPVVKVALDMWKSDMLQVTGMMPVASSKGVIKVLQSKGSADGFRITVKGRQIIMKRTSIGRKFWHTINSAWPRNIPAPMRTDMVPITEERMPDGVDSAGIVNISVSDIDQRPPIEQP